MSITLASFKQANGVSTLDFNMNPKTDRAIASFMNKDGIVVKLVTKPLKPHLNSKGVQQEGFNPKLPVYVYDCIEGDEIVPNVHILSNAKGAEPAFSL